MKTVNGSAVCGEDYKDFDKDLTFEKNESLKSIHIEIVDDYEWEPDEIFFVKLSIPEQAEAANREHIALGNVSIVQITIINDDGNFTTLFMCICM